SREGRITWPSLRERRLESRQHPCTRLPKPREQPPLGQTIITGFCFLDRGGMNSLELGSSPQSGGPRSAHSDSSMRGAQDPAPWDPDATHTVNIRGLIAAMQG